MGVYGGYPRPPRPTPVFPLPGGGRCPSEGSGGGGDAYPPTAHAQGTHAGQLMDDACPLPCSRTVVILHNRMHTPFVIVTDNLCIHCGAVDCRFYVIAQRVNLIFILFTWNAYRPSFTVFCAVFLCRLPKVYINADGGVLLRRFVDEPTVKRLFHRNHGHAIGALLKLVRYGVGCLF